MLGAATYFFSQGISQLSPQLLFHPYYLDFQLEDLVHLGKGQDGEWD